MNFIMFVTFLNFVRFNIWPALLLCILPIVIYILVFHSVALNVNYIAFDDIAILGIISKFEDASWLQRWKQLTELFPEHRLVFSRSVILLLYYSFGKVNLVWPMIIGSVCWGLCASIFYMAFEKTKLSCWYFVPVIWLWFNIQSFENIFWGVSSLCNFGVLLFVLSALYFTCYHPQQTAISMFFAVAATFTYGNGLMVFPIIGLLYLITGRHKQFLITLTIALVTSLIYFSDFTPITQNLNFSNPQQVKEGFLGLFGFIGSIATITAYSMTSLKIYQAIITGILFVVMFIYLFRKQFLQLWNSVLLKIEYKNQTVLFALSLILFVSITALALTYKRIPTDTLQGMFKGRYRMYSTLWCMALYFVFIAQKSRLRYKLCPFILFSAIAINLVILHNCFAEAVNNRRAAIVQEFNARYNADWFGIRMFSITQKHFEEIRSYYQSEDPLAEGWNVLSRSEKIPCHNLDQPVEVTKTGDFINIHFPEADFKAEKDFSDGAYVLLKSRNRVYASPSTQFPVPLKTVIRRQMYFAKGLFFVFHVGTFEPGLYHFYLLVRKNGQNRIFYTGKTWNKTKHDQNF
jgi:hypothetical protein